MDNGASSYRRFLDGDESAFKGILSGEAAIESLGHSYTKVVIRNADNAVNERREITDELEITKICRTIQEYSAGLGGTAPEMNEEFRQTQEAGAPENGESSKQTGYVIIFITEDDREMIYSLEHNQLYNESQNVKIILTDEQTAELKVVLGIWKED